MLKAIECIILHATVVTASITTVWVTTVPFCSAHYFALIRYTHTVIDLFSVDPFNNTLKRGKLKTFYESHNYNSCKPIYRYRKLVKIHYSKLLEYFAKWDFWCSFFRILIIIYSINIRILLIFTGQLYNEANPCRAIVFCLVSSEGIIIFCIYTFFLTRDVLNVKFKTSAQRKKQNYKHTFTQ